MSGMSLFSAFSTITCTEKQHCSQGKEQPCSVYPTQQGKTTGVSYRNSVRILVTDASCLGLPLLCTKNTTIRHWLSCSKKSRTTERRRWTSPFTMWQPTLPSFRTKRVLLLEGLQACCHDDFGALTELKQGPGRGYSRVDASLNWNPSPPKLGKAVPYACDAGRKTFTNVR